MEHQSTPNLAAALAKAQGAYGHIRKNRTVTVKMKAGGSYEFRYATLDSVLAATKEALAENGLALVSTIENGKLTVTLMHASGEEQASALPIPDPLKGGWQEFGSAVQYGRRYLINALLNTNAEHDDDGNKADGHEVTAEETEADPLQALWDALEAKGIGPGKPTKDYCERALGRALSTDRSLTLADLPTLLETLEGKRPLPPERNLCTSEERDALNKALEKLAPWGEALEGMSPPEAAAGKKAAKLAYINGMLKPPTYFKSSAELTSEQVKDLIAKAGNGEVP